MILHVFDQRPLDFPAIPSHLNYFQVVVQHARSLAGPGCSLKIQAQPSSAKVGHFQLKNQAPHSSAFSAKVSHLSQIQPFSAKFTENGWTWLNMAENGWKWLNLAEFWLKMAEFWLKMAEIQPNSAIFIQSPAKIQPFSAKFSHFQPFWLNLAENCYTGVDQITTKYAGGSAHCQDTMLPRGRCFPRINPSSAHLFL